jgi:uncharacterized protein YodC (DUF2158 family)
MANDIKPGDIVQLNSGGPAMTVARLEHINGVLNAVCGWFNGKKQEIGTFPVAMLKCVSV